MDQTAKAVVIGIAAGALSALLSAGLSQGFALLFVAAPLPVLAAMLGWGTVAGAIAAATAILAAAMLASPLSAVSMALIVALPAALTGFLANLARPAEEMSGPAGKLVWFPLADILFYSSLAMAAGMIVLGILHSYGPDFGAEVAKAATQGLLQADPALQISAEDEARMAGFFTAVLPAQLPGIWVAILTANLYLALRGLEAAGLMKRPRDDWPTALRLPQPALFVFGAALVAAFLPGAPGWIASAFAGALGAGFLMAGVALLHARTRGQSWRPAALAAGYAGALLFLPALFLFLVAGLTDTRRQAVLSDSRSHPSA